MKENFLSEQVDRCRLKANMDEINWSNDFPICFPQILTAFFPTVDLESLGMKENRTVPIMLNPSFQNFSHFVIDTIGNRTWCRN